MKLKLIIGFAIVAIGIGSYFAFSAIRNQQFTKSAKPATPQTASDNQNTPDLSSDASSISDNSADSEITDEPEETTEIVDHLDNSITDNTTENNDSINPGTTDTFMMITKNECSNSCNRFDDEETLRYCLEVCGLAQPDKNIKSCNQLEDLEKDYCQKNLAIEKNDVKLCNSIIDANIKKICQSRITEEAMDNLTPKTQEGLNY